MICFSRYHIRQHHVVFLNVQFHEYLFSLFIPLLDPRCLCKFPTYPQHVVESLFVKVSSLRSLNSRLRAMWFQKFGFDL